MARKGRGMKRAMKRFFFKSLCFSGNNFKVVRNWIVTSQVIKCLQANSKQNRTQVFYFAQNLLRTKRICDLNIKQSFCIFPVLPWPGILLCMLLIYFWWVRLHMALFALERPPKRAISLFKRLSNLFVYFLYLSLQNLYSCICESWMIRAI